MLSIMQEADLIVTEFITTMVFLPKHSIRQVISLQNPVPPQLLTWFNFNPSMDK